MVSAHWTTNLPMVGGATHPETLHDFGGFPQALYALRYPAPGAPELANSVREALLQAGITTGLDAGRGLDHGAWVPLRFLFPQADVPVVPLSVQTDRGARHHIALGRALRTLREQNVLIIASGHLTHNLRDWMQRHGGTPHPATVTFRDWAHHAILDGDIEALSEWEHRAPDARFAHPTPEHFLPLFVALGAAGENGCVRATGGGWADGVLAAESYLWD